MFSFTNKERTKRRRIQRNSNNADDDPPLPKEKGDPIFRGLLFYLDPDTINFTRRAVLHDLIEKYGGRFVTGDVNTYVTHILVDEGLSNNRLHGTLIWTTYPHQMEVLMVTWLSACINANECLETIGYQVRRNRRPSINPNVRPDIQGAVYSSNGREGSSEETKFDFVSEENSTFDDGKYDDETSCEDEWLITEPPDIYILPNDPFEFDSPSPSIQEEPNSKETQIMSSTSATEVNVPSCSNKPEGEAPFASSNPVVARLSKVRVRVIPEHLRVPGESAVVVELNNENDPPLPLERSKKVNDPEQRESETKELSDVGCGTEEAPAETQVVSCTSNIEREDNNQKPIDASNIKNTRAVPVSICGPMYSPLTSDEIVIPDILEDYDISKAEPLVSSISSTQEPSRDEHIVDKMDVESVSEEVSHKTPVKFVSEEASQKSFQSESVEVLHEKCVQSVSEEVSHEKCYESGFELSDKELVKSGIELSDKDLTLGSGAELLDKEPVLESKTELSEKDLTVESGAELSNTKTTLVSDQKLVLNSGNELANQNLSIGYGNKKLKHPVKRYKENEFVVEILDSSDLSSDDESVIVVSSDSERKPASSNESYSVESSDIQSTDHNGVYPLNLYCSSAGFADSERMSCEESSTDWFSSDFSFSIQAADGTREMIDAIRFRECINNDTCTYVVVNEITSISNDSLPPENPDFNPDYDNFATFDYFDRYNSSTPCSPIIDTFYRPPRSFSRTNISDPDFPFPMRGSSFPAPRDPYQPSTSSRNPPRPRIISTMPDNPNIKIINQLKLLYECHKRVGCKWRIHAYEAAILALARRRKLVESLKEAQNLPGVGKTIAAKIWKIAQTGELKELDDLYNRRWVESMKLFTRAWGISPRLALKLCKEGFCTIFGLQTKSDLSRGHLVGLNYYEDLKTKMTQEETKLIIKTVLKIVFHLYPNLQADACSSLRRKKLRCGHACLLLSLPSGIPNNHKMLPAIVAKLHQKGLLIDDLIRHEENGNQTRYVGIIRLSKNDKHRRICITLIPREEHPAALMYLTGPAYFNKAMQQWAIKKDMVLDEHSLRLRVLNLFGGTEAVTNLFMSTESLIFQQLGLPYRPPEHRERALT